MKTQQEQNSLLERAIGIALMAHAGLMDKHGKAYILHALRVGVGGRTIEEQVAGILHDVVEDTRITFETLRGIGIPEDILDVLDHLTKRDEEDYEEYIERTMLHPVARRVKLRDLEDNMNIRRGEDVVTSDAERLSKYVRAWHSIQELD